MEILRETPEKEVLEWYISLRGKDAKGVAVRLDLINHRLVPDQNFEQRRRDWVLRHFDDPYSLAVMPDPELLDDYLAGDKGVFFDLKKHILERPI